MNYDEKCSHHLKCSSNICILDSDIHLRNHIPVDGLCFHILDYCERKETLFDAEIKKTEGIWRAKIPAHVLAGRLKSRQQVRKHFENRQKSSTSANTGNQIVGQAR